VFDHKPLYLHHVIEFQARGVPHAHILLRLGRPNFTTGAEVDEHVSVADPWWDPDLRAIVTTLMTHTCRHPHCYPKERAMLPVSMRNCRKRFPMPVSDVTVQDECDSFWTHKRKKGEEYIVQYNPLLLRIFKAHINVQVAAGDGSIFYLHKYMHKQFENVEARLVTQNPRSMTQAKQLDIFHSARYMTAGEAFWEALSLPFTKMTPPSTRTYRETIGTPSPLTLSKTRSSELLTVASRAPCIGACNCTSSPCNNMRTFAASRLSSCTRYTW
jgi:hypothetical protein